MLAEDPFELIIKSYSNDNGRRLSKSINISKMPFSMRRGHLFWANSDQLEGISGF